MIMLPGAIASNYMLLNILIKNRAVASHKSIYGNMSSLWKSHSQLLFQFDLCMWESWLVGYKISPVSTFAYWCSAIKDWVIIVCLAGFSNEKPFVEWFMFRFMFITLIDKPVWFITIILDRIGYYVSMFIGHLIRKLTINTYFLYDYDITFFWKLSPF